MGSRRKKTKSKIEVIKENSDYLRAPLLDEVGNDSSHFGKEAIQVLKFHGTYQQDDRDLREGRDRHYIFMIRGRLPGGKMTADQYLAIDEIADKYANETLRVTTRQAFQLHGVIKSELKDTLREINNSLITTLGACGDIVRNVMATPAPDIDGRQAKVQEFADELSDILLPASKAYHEVWLNGDKVYSGKEEVEEGEPLYGESYLPRKFKVGIALPEDNSVDLYTQDIGLVALFDDNNEIEGFNVTVGGGMGMNHRKENTFPRLGDDLGYVTKDKVVDVVKGIIEIQRDHGDRKNRKQARMKYLIHKWGLEKFEKELISRIGFELQPFRDMPDFDLDLYLGWNQQSDGNWFLGLSIENGRIKDDGELKLKTAVRKVVKEYGTGVRLTPNHNILLTDVKEEDKEDIEDIFHEHGVLLHDEIANVIKYSMACPALPTCGLAITESERALPDIIRDLDGVLQELGLENEKLSVRMTGCPNGCSRPYVADIGFVGRSLDKYTIFIGGNPEGTRLNKEYKDLIDREDLVDEVRPLLKHFKENRSNGESFSDFWNRVGLEETEEIPA
ncbi:NADPH-dependent assimilatory sulfite reductase hemoprotein subunit [Aliifodinibius sp. S!AR15-10]|uniref:NADPH-dependent assimilatory sulfite reductase hemoprotein subunit n=1 Tax=Aliifodinibius sp. S!AR15-10 TaxID=2950437 RepID=UPI002863CE9F|nr:NADPH-dependent assimilatory sulfite reductase hemoprotein subunit [Aliifodinibius sp. S!AR15-10]MDR8392272.1 NADPH-dependent assimilatory sulfite reductase hemoprotein subunit [Aliifodinibius sp. S!AR15-10]